MAAVICFVNSGFKNFIKKFAKQKNKCIFTHIIQGIYNALHNYYCQSSERDSIESKYLVGSVRVKKTEILMLKHVRVYESIYEN
jgi:hypothetical protein